MDRLARRCRGCGCPTYGSYRNTSHPKGYVRVWRPGHPVAHADGYALEHRLVAYEAGLDIDGLVVHHVNGDPADNRLENLEVVTPGEHRRRHALPDEERRVRRAARLRAWKAANREHIREYRRARRRAGLEA